MAWDTNGGKKAEEAAELAMAATEEMNNLLPTVEAVVIANAASTTANLAIIKARDAEDFATDAKEKSNTALTISETVKNEFDRVVADAGGNNPEVVLARGNYVNLPTRLEAEKTELAQQLAQTATKAEVADKVEKSYVDTITQSLASGSPKGIYATLTALETAFPTGNSNIYVVSADGKWYYWSGTTWAAGGIYQSTGIADNTVTPSKTTFTKPNLNKFLGDYRTNMFISTANNLAYGTNLMTAIFPVIGGQTYHLKKSGGNRSRFGWHKTLPPDLKSGDPTVPVDYPVGDIGNSSVQTAPLDATYGVLTVHSGTPIDVKLQVTTSDEPLFVGYDFISSENISGFLPLKDKMDSVGATTTAQLYGTRPILKLDYNTKTATIPSGIRLFYNGKRTVINNVDTPLTWNWSELTAIYFDKITGNVALHQITTSNTLPQNAVLIGIIRSTQPEVFGIDIENCEVNGKLYVNPQIESKITEKVNSIDTAKYFILDDISGIYEKPSDIANVAIGQTFELEKSLHTDIYAIYDDLVARFPDYVSRTLLGNDATGLPIHLYKFTSPEVSYVSFKYKKLKLLFASAIHGSEKGSAWCLAHFFKDLCDNHQTKEQLNYMRWNIDFTVVPVVTPYAYDLNQRKNSNGVDINRNFPANWTLGSDPNDMYYGGASAASEIETQLLMNVIDSNTDCEYFIDYHNIGSGYPLFYLYDEKASTIALNTIRTMTRKWRKDYPTSSQTNMHGLIKAGVNACAAKYAIQKNMKSFVFETPFAMPFATSKFDKTTIETGIELFGNTLVTILKSIK